MDLAGAVPLEVVRCASEELPFAGHRLNTNACVPVLQGLLDGRDHAVGDVPGWRAELFCEYPQEIVFRVCDPSRLDSLVVVSDATLIAHRIEIFLSSSTARDWRHARFERLGFITLQSPRETQCVAQELKTIPLTQSASTISYIKLLVHTCHVHTANLFNQVGLACFVALSEMPSLQQYDASLAAAVRRRVEEARPTAESIPLLSPLKPGRQAPPSNQEAIWIADRREYVTPLELLTRIQRARERHAVIVQRSAVDGQREQHQWAIDECECMELCDKLTQLRARERTAWTVDDRLDARKQMDAVVDMVCLLDARVRQREAALQTQLREALATHLAHSPIKTSVTPKKTASVFRDKDKWTTLVAWHAREEYLWEIVDAVKRWGNSETRDLAVVDEAVVIAMTGLRDAHTQVFIAATSLLLAVIQLHPRFQEGTAWKHEVASILKSLASRLDDPQPPVRNNAAFSLVKVAELTRAKGAFVLHTLLSAIEKGATELSDPTFYGLLKVCSALLMSFHCCATLDISVNRFLRLLVHFKGLAHENGHVREAARELLIVLHGDVGSEPILTYLRKKKPPAQVVAETETLLDMLTGRKEASVSLEDTPVL